MQLQIIKAEEADLPLLNQLSRVSKMHWNYPSEWLNHWLPEMTLTAQDLEENWVFKLLTADSLLAGFCLIAEQPMAYEIQHLWLKPAHIGNGWGKFLLQESLKRVAVIDKPIRVEADPHAEGFYAKLGFRTIGYTQSYPPDRYIPLMEKSPDCCNGLF